MSELTPAEIERFALEAALSLDVYAAGQKAGLTTEQIARYRSHTSVQAAIADRLASAAEIAAIAEPQALAGLLIARANTPAQLRDVVAAQQARLSTSPADDDIDELMTEAWDQ